MTYPSSYPVNYPGGLVVPGQPVAPLPGWPQLIIEGGFATVSPVQPSGTFLLGDAVFGVLGTDILGGDVTWSDLTAWARSGSVSRPAARTQGPLWSYQPGTASIVLSNRDGRFDPDNLGGPYVAAGQTELTAMVPVRVRATWNGITYPLFSGFADSWGDDGRNYAGRYAQSTLSATDGQKVLGKVTLPAAVPVGAGELSGARVNRVLTTAGWYTGTGQRNVAAGNSSVQAYAGGDTAWNLMQAAADSEIGELYVDGAGRLTFRNRHAILEDARSAVPQAVFGDAAGTAETAGTEQAYYSVTRARDDATLANDVQATRAGGTTQEVKDAASIARYLFPRTYANSSLILQDDVTTLNWAQWVLYVAGGDEDRFDAITLFPLRDPASLWPQALGREVGDRIQVWRRPPGVASPVTRDCFIRGIAHAWDWSAGTWATTWTLQDASKYGSFLTLGNAATGQLGFNALTFLGGPAGVTASLEHRPGAVRLGRQQLVRPPRRGEDQPADRHLQHDAGQ